MKKLTKVPSIPSKSLLLKSTFDMFSKKIFFWKTFSASTAFGGSNKKETFLSFNSLFCKWIE